MAKNHARRQPALILRIAKAYLAGSDSGLATPTWQQAMDATDFEKKAQGPKPLPFPAAESVDLQSTTGAQF